ncbi:hypothetical protein [Calothrix sp. 336/3]|uniref:hypothetical protein n=1 Tax=Calothrix sp. 336/3 TaxID=1337936 RepID=UPI000AE53B56|nr:hypothetical protein [Calothrix sp. 336/3]
MIPPKKSAKVLLLLLIINNISTLFHYLDNAIFIDKYPEPQWFSTPGVLSVLIVMTPIGWLGYRLYCQSHHLFAYLCLIFYSLTSISSPGHYLYPMTIPMSLKMHFLIWLDAFSGLSLISFVVWSIFLSQVTITESIKSEIFQK